MDTISSKDAYSGQFRLTLSDMQVIDHMLNKGIDWRAIERQTFPQIPIELLQKKHRKHVAGLDGQTQPKFNITQEDELDIGRLLLEKESWQQIAELKYPAYSGNYVAKT